MDMVVEADVDVDDSTSAVACSGEPGLVMMSDDEGVAA